MSADNWAVCPKCREEKNKKRVEVEKSYGKVSAKEYNDVLALLDDEDLERESLREDYEIGIDAEGFFSVNYRAACIDCAFTFNYSFYETR